MQWNDVRTHNASLLGNRAHALAAQPRGARRIVLGDLGELGRALGRLGREKGRVPLREHAGRAQRAEGLQNCTMINSEKSRNAGKSAAKCTAMVVRMHMQTTTRKNPYERERTFRR